MSTREELIDRVARAWAARTGSIVLAYVPYLQVWSEATLRSMLRDLDDDASKREEADRGAP